MEARGVGAGQMSGGRRPAVHVVAVHVVPVRTYALVFAALLALTGLTIGVSEIELGPLNAVAALAIAFTKAVLVALFFMHLRHSTRLIWLVALAGLFWLAILIGLTLEDFASRGWLAGQGG